MKVDMGKKLVGFDGKTIRETKITQRDGKLVEEEDPNGREVTLAIVCAGALSKPLEGDERLAADKVVARWKLAMRVHGATGEVELTPEEATEIRERIPRLFALVLAGQAIEMLKG